MNEGGIKSAGAGPSGRSSEAEAERRLLEAVLEAAPVSIVVASSDGRGVRMNSAHRELWGPIPSDGTAEWKAWWADGSERHGRRLAFEEWALIRALLGETVPGDVVEIEPFDRPGERRTVINSAAPVRDAAGQVVGAVVAQLDMTARVEAEAALRANEERYRLVTRATADIIWDWDFATQTIHWNEALTARIGGTSEDLSKIEAWSDRIHPDDREGVTARIYEAIERGDESWSDEYRFARADGSYAPILDRGYIMRDASGKAVRMIGSMLDLTERQQADSALRESELFHRQVIDSIPGMVFTNRPDGVCEFLSEPWIEFTGVPAERQLGDAWVQSLHPDDRERAFAAWRGAVERGGRYDVEFRLRRHDGAYEWFKVRSRPIHDAAGSIVRWFGTATNIHDLKTAEEALRTADRHKDEFLAMLAHELRNPLAPVRNAVEILKLLGPEEPTLERARSIIERQVTHMSRLIDDLLDVSRIARGKIQLRRERHDLAAIVRQTAEDYRANLESGGVRLSATTPVEPLWVDGDETRLAQVLGNLLHNAGKFTEPGGEVTVTLAPDASGGAAMLSVEDTGVGIEPELIARLFNPFSQADQDLARTQGGLGLGLALVAGLVRLHGGTVRAESEGLGRGSRFTVRLPLAVPVEARGRGPGAGNGGAEGCRVLVIEDNRDSAECLELLLDSMGHTVSLAFEGPSGLEAARSLAPDLVLCDIGLPGMDGYAVARGIRADPRLADTLLVAVSGYGQEEDRKRSAEAGFDRHLIKPADSGALAEVLELAARRRLSRGARGAPSPGRGCGAGPRRLER